MPRAKKPDQSTQALVDQTKPSQKGNLATPISTKPVRLPQNLSGDIVRSTSPVARAYIAATIIGQISGTIVMVSGFILTLLGLSGNLQMLIHAPGITAKIANASPGVFFALIGFLLMWRYKPNIHEKMTIKPNSVTMDNKLFRDTNAPSGIIETPRLPIGEPVTIPDVNLTSALAKVLNKPTGPLGDLELASLQGADLSDCRIESIEGIQACKNLQVLSLEHNPVQHIAPLAEMHSLKVLSLNSTGISDLSPIARLVNLEELYIGGCKKLTDISVLEHLTNLKRLSLAYSAVSDIEPLLKNATSRGIGKNTEIILWGTPLSWQALNVHIPMIKSLGVQCSL